MPVKIQELIIQTKIKAGDTQSLDTSAQNRYINQQELKYFEKGLYFNCVDAMDVLLRECEER